MQGTNNSEYVKNIKVSIGQEITKTSKLSKVVTLDEIIKEIKTSFFIKKLVKDLKNIEEEEKQRKFKAKELPYFVAATFNDNVRRKKNLISTELMVYDYDHLGDTVEEKRKILVSDQRVLLVFTSPRGGLKVIYRLSEEITDYNKYSRLYKHYAKLFELDLGREPDITSDVSRACFFSYDPNLYLNYDAIPLPVDIPLDEAPDNSNQEIINFSEVKAQELAVVIAAVKYLKKNVKLDYHDWIKCGLALVSLPQGRELFLELSRNEHYSDTEEEINYKFDNLEEAYEGDITIASLIKIAQDNGFVYEPKEELPDNSRLPLHMEMIERFNIDDTRDPNKLLGYPLTKFNQLANHLDGIQPGLYFIGAEPNIGKTALLMNFTLDLLETNPEVSVIYFSLDDDRTKIAYRLLSILCKLHIKEVRRGTNIALNKDLVVEKRKVLIELLASGRLLIPDLVEVNQINHLAKFLNEHKKKNLIICIDGLYNLDVSGKDGIRVENIERANAVKLIVDKLGIPILVTGELRKRTKGESKDKKPTMDDLMESGKYAYNASVVWLLYSEENNDLNFHKPTLIMEYCKNKVSDYKGIQKIIFERNSGIINEEKNFNNQSYNPGGKLE